MPAGSRKANSYSPHLTALFRLWHLLFDWHKASCCPGLGFESCHLGTVFLLALLEAEYQQGTET